MSSGSHRWKPTKAERLSIRAAMTDDGPFPYTPDYVVAPGETLKEWLEYNGLSVRVACVTLGEHKEAGIAMMTRVLARQPYGEEDCKMLAYVTNISAAFWRNMEHNYRAGLAAGLKDVSDG